MRIKYVAVPTLYPRLTLGYAFLFLSGRKLTFEFIGRFQASAQMRFLRRMNTEGWQVVRVYF